MKQLIYLSLCIIYIHTETLYLNEHKTYNIIIIIHNNNNDNNNNNNINDTQPPSYYKITTKYFATHVPSVIICITTEAP